MSREKRIEFHKKMSSMDEKEYIESYLTYTLAPVIAGYKPASTINLSKVSKWNDRCKSFIEELGLEYILLREESNTVIVLVYKRDMLEEYLKEPTNREFLLRLGYKKVASIEEDLLKLKERYNLYHCPHELGTFLGFPIDDVEDFMNCTSKKCLLCGYWQVYNDEEKALRVFRLYDESKEYVVNNLLDGLEINQVVSRLKQIAI